MDDWSVPIMLFIVWSIYLGLGVYILTWEYMYEKIIEERLRAGRISTELTKERMGIRNVHNV